MTHNTFADFYRNPNLWPTEARVAGFSTWNNATAVGETIFAVFHDGSTFKAEVASGTADFFNHDSRIWVQVDAIPEDAVFLGRYAPPPVNQRHSITRAEIEGQLSVADDMGLHPAEARMLISGSTPETDCREYDWTNG